MSSINTLLPFILWAIISKIRCNDEISTCEFGERTISFLDTVIEFIDKAKESVSPAFSEDNCICPKKPMDCEELLQCGHNISGVYNIWPRNRITEGKVEVYCDMTTDGGGWTVIQRRGDFNRSKDYFFKGWDSYKRGFGNLEEDFWLGNDHIFSISNQGKYSIRFDLRDVEGNVRYALYDQFWIESEDQKYRVHVGDYRGDANDSFNSDHNGQKFSTKDNDNDNHEKSCAEVYKGAWWYNKCHGSNLNGLYLHGKHKSYADGIIWASFKGAYESLESSEMKLRPSDHGKIILNNI